MTSAIISNLEKLLGGPRDSALLRYSLGNEWLKAGDAPRAVAYLRAALERQPDYSAAWKLLGQACLKQGLGAEARLAWENGLEIARQRGDKQTEKEMLVFLRRLDKSAGTS